MNINDWDGAPDWDSMIYGDMRSAGMQEPYAPFYMGPDGLVSAGDTRGLTSGSATGGTLTLPTTTTTTSPTTTTTSGTIARPTSGKAQPLNLNVLVSEGVTKPIDLKQAYAILQAQKAPTTTTQPPVKVTAPQNVVVTGGGGGGGGPREEPQEETPADKVEKLTKGLTKNQKIGLLAGGVVLAYLIF